MPHLNHFETAGIQKHFLKFDVGIFRCNVSAAFEEKTVAHPHNIGFVHGRHSFSSLLAGEVKGVSDLS